MSLTFEFESNRKTVRYPTIILHLNLISSRYQQTALRLWLLPPYPDGTRRHSVLSP